MRLWIGCALGLALCRIPAYTQASSYDDPVARMHEFDAVSRWAHDSGGLPNTPPLAEGSDDDPTLAADVIEHAAPARAQKLAARGEESARKQRHEKAIADFLEALRIDPKYYEASNDLAMEYARLGQNGRAIEILNALTRSEPKHVLAFDNLAIVLCAAGRYAEAEQAATEAYRMHPFSYKAAYVYGAALVRQGKWTADARQSLRYASLKHPEAKELLARWPAPNTAAPGLR